ncbi:pirin family protein [Methylocapsa polymorpha]|uniref:Pirin family protein n=1 Tax=Methylocapsa polymorpha TaxID=3080828 RepID=A0ABZ0HSF0_9HYPH|nr:pirin family protein [Methylocapsa sp. RX1]
MSGLEKNSQGRKVIWSGQGMATSDGAGVRLTRIIGQRDLPDLDPFLLLDEFSSDDPKAYIAGFPDHPHRGFETVTYMLAGRMRHRDNKGHEGLLRPGSVQWMTAGRGIVHSEMPEQEEGLLRGFQLWINLPAREKLRPPRYQEFAPERIPSADVGVGASAKILAGHIGGAHGLIEAGATQPFYFDLVFRDAAAAEIPLPEDHSGFVYVYEGDLGIGEVAPYRLARGDLGVLSSGASVRLAAGAAGARALLVGGKPIGEPIVRYGPFVMNTREEVCEAMADFQAGRF